MREHLRRLDLIYREPAIFFITACAHHRRAIFASDNVAEILLTEWRGARSRHHWLIGRYVIMPDHVHFFCAPERDSKTLSEFIGAWKSWTSRGIRKVVDFAADPLPIWQPEFFDHLIRSSESYDQKWEYVRDNPVRAGLVSSADEWKYAGEIEQLSL